MSLLRLHDDVDITPFIEIANVRNVPLTVVDLRSQVVGERYGASLLLIRPDQHVAWRGASVDRVTAGSIIDRIRGG